MTIPAIGAISAALPSLASLPSTNVAPTGLALPTVGEPAAALATRPPEDPERGRP